MTAEHRAEQSILHPAHIQLLELRILRRRGRALGIVGATEESTDVSIEIGIARQREAQSGRHLFAQHIPRRVHVAAPHVRAVVLLTGKRRARHDEDTLLAISFFALGLINAANGFQREGITL